MPIARKPDIGEWYLQPGGEPFEIVARDDADDTLELQFFDGTVDEIDYEIWESLQPEPIEPPEDWQGAVDIAAEARETEDDWLQSVQLNEFLAQH